MRYTPHGPALPEADPVRPSVNLRRRGFLLSVGAGALGSATAAAASVPGVTAPVAAPEADVKRGYQETEHVRRYYRTTMI